MTVGIYQLGLLVVVFWPLLLLMGVALSATRTAAVRLLPSAPLPALLVAVGLVDTTLPLPALLMGGGLTLDDTGRTFLLLAAMLWLAVGLLAHGRLREPGGTGFAILLLLATTGGVTAALAADAVLFFGASSLLGYATYGLLSMSMDASAQRSARPLVALLVVSDLVVFELLLLLGQAAGSVEFVYLREALAVTDNQSLILLLIIVGFGIKTGVVGVHYWLAPAFNTAPAALRPALLAFLLGAGLLGWLRLLPLGADLAGAGSVLLWLAWATLLFALLVGSSQAQSRVTLAYVAMALTGLWLAVVGSGLLFPDAWNELISVMHTAILQAGLALAALLLYESNSCSRGSVWKRRVDNGGKWLATLLLAAAAVGVAESMWRVDGSVGFESLGLGAGVAFLAIRARLQMRVAARALEETAQTNVGHESTQAPAVVCLSVAAVLTVAATVAAALSSFALWVSAPGITVLTVALTGVAAWLSVNRFPVPPSFPIFNRVRLSLRDGWNRAVDVGRGVANLHLPRWRDAGLAGFQELRRHLDWRQSAGSLETRLGRWSDALFLCVVLGLLTAGLAVWA